MNTSEITHTEERGEEETIVNMTQTNNPITPSFHTGSGLIDDTTWLSPVGDRTMDPTWSPYSLSTIATPTLIPNTTDVETGVVYSLVGTHTVQ